eukprot:5834756-Pyramimonas_sp.AAC.1
MLAHSFGLAVTSICRSSIALPGANSSPPSDKPLSLPPPASGSSAATGMHFASAWVRGWVNLCVGGVHGRLHLGAASERLEAEEARKQHRGLSGTGPPEHENAGRKGGITR